MPGDRVTLSGRAREQTNPLHSASTESPRYEGSRSGRAVRSGTALARAMANETAVRKSIEPVPLSYENALQRHSRRRSSGEVPELPREQIEPYPKTREEAPQSAKHSTANPTAAPPAASKPPSQPARSHAPTPTEVPSARKDRIVYSTGTQQTKRAKQASQAKTKKARNKARQRNATGRQESAAPVIAAIRQLVQQSESVSMQPVPHTAIQQLRVPRRDTVSVRLSENESDQLRQRAAESGLSVSAYMRSCVLEADHLRAQVKLALTELRANVNQREVAQLSPSPGTETDRGWLRIFSRTAALLLAPVLWLRHRI